MGWWSSSRERIEVFSATSPLFDAEPFDTKKALVYGIMHSIPIHTILLNNSMIGFSSKINSMREYAKNTYSLGLADSGRSKSGVFEESAVINAITTDLSLPYGCILDFNYTNPLNTFDIVIPFLINIRKFNIVTGAITVFPEGFVPITQFGEIELQANVFVINVNISADGTNITITYVSDSYYLSWDETNHETGEYGWVTHYPTDPVTLTEEYVSPLVQFIGATYCIAGYRPKDAEGNTPEETSWWFYSMDSSTYPDLIEEVEITEGVSYPVIPIRYENQFISSSNSPEIYSQGKVMLNKVGIGFDDIVNTLSENEAINDIDHAYVMFGVNAQTEDPVALKYLVDFFTFLSQGDDIDAWDVLYGTLLGNNAPKHTAIDFVKGDIEVPETETVTTTVQVEHDGETETLVTTVTNPTSGEIHLIEHGLDINLTYRSITSVIVSGNIKEDGSAKPGDIIKELVAVPNTSYFWKGMAYLSDGSQLILKEQLTNNAYRHIIVVGLVHSNRIYDDRYVVTSIGNVMGDPYENNLIIPLHYSVVRRMVPTDQSNLCQQAMMLVCTGYDIYKVAWYEQGPAKFVIAAIAVMLTVWSLGKSLYGYAALLSKEGLAAVALAAMQDALIAFAIKIAIDLTVKLVGIELAIIIAVLLIVASGFKGGRALFALLGVVRQTALTMLQLAATIIKSATALVTDMLEEIADEYDLLLADHEAKMQLVEDKQKELFGTLTEAPEYLLYRDSKFYVDMTEPELYYAKKIHTGNIGTLVLDVIPNYVNTSLSLPTFNPFENPVYST